MTIDSSGASTFGGNVTVDGGLSITGVNAKIVIGGQQVFSSARNMTNVGTIASGAITSSGTVDIGGGRIALTGQSSGTEVNSSIRAHTNNYTYMFGGSSGLSISNNTGEDTRIKLNDSNTMQMYTSGTERLKIDSNGDISFYNDSSSQGLYWDSSASRLGLGTTAPSSPLTVNATGSSEGIRVQRNGVSSQYISIHEATGGDHVIEAYGDKAMNIGKH